MDGPEGIMLSEMSQRKANTVGFHLCACAQSCLTLCDSMDCSPPDDSVHGIFQARILEWVAISYSRGSPLPRDWTRISCDSSNGRRILCQLRHLGRRTHITTKKNNEHKQQNRNRLIKKINKWLPEERGVGDEWNRWERLRNTNFQL